ncbi:MAG TPA: C40 family peptidase [Gaiellaceae bacterium]|nr:C40 family peptidase [Gaiellaceae bacterium]
MKPHLRLARAFVLALAAAVLLALAPGRAAAASSGSAAGKARAGKLDLGVRAVKVARKMLGVPYRWGGASPRSGFDCSGLVRFVYGRLGISLPHSSYADFALGRRVARHRLKPGDLVFFHGLGHVGIYAGHGKFIHAPRTGTRVRYSTLAEYGAAYDGARRLSA